MAACGLCMNTYGMNNITCVKYYVNATTVATVNTTVINNTSTLNNTNTNTNTSLVNQTNNSLVIKQIIV